MSPNVLLVVIDSLRADVLHAPHVATDNIDALAQRGSLFKQCIATATTTTPSFSSLLTGCYPPKHGVRGLQGYRLAPSITTMPEAFAKADYHTYAEVTGPLLPETGVLRGFEDARHRPAYKQEFFGWRDGVVARMKNYSEPWLMLLHIWEVHRPFRPPPHHEKRYDRRAYEAVVSATDERLAEVFEAAGDDTIIVITGDHGEEYPDTSFGGLANRAAYRLRRSLKPSLWFPWLDRKLSARMVGHGFALFEHLIRVPLILTGPGISPTIIEDQVRHVDLFPTLADLCSIDVPDEVDGRSLYPLTKGGSLSEEPAYLEAVGVKLEGNRIQGVRTPDWKLLRYGNGRPVLYDLKGNGERRNLYRRYPEVARRLELFMDAVAAASTETGSGMTAEEEATVEQHLKDLGYL
jgi:arylsulfatase A-like enzyme